MGEEVKFFRTEGMLYLRVERGHSELAKSETKPEMGDRLDEVSLQIMHARNRIEYEDPEQKEYLLEILKVLESCHQESCPHQVRPAPLSKHQWVTLGGSGMEFDSMESYDRGEEITCHLSFPAYPFASVTIPARVRDCTSMTTGHRSLVEFHDIPENDRELIIKYVNHLQRASLAKKSASN